jgi:coenzyme F420-reducing hydrogenase delta subunit
MKKNKTSRRLLIVTVALVLFICLMAVGINIVFDPFIEQVAFYPSNLGSFLVTGSFKINPETILTALDRGESGVFIPGPLYTEASVAQDHFLWNQSDYLRIATKVF